MRQWRLLCHWGLCRSYFQELLSSFATKLTYNEVILKPLFSDDPPGSHVISDLLLQLAFNLNPPKPLYSPLQGARVSIFFSIIPNPLGMFWVVKLSI